MKYLKLIAGLLAVIFAMSIAAPANATPYLNWRMRDGANCFVTGGSVVWSQAITSAMMSWNKSDINVVADRSCSAFPRGRQIRIAAYYDSTAPYACAYTKATSWSWEYVHANGVRRAAWVPNDMTIYLNMASAAYGCRDTYLDRLHLISHEGGHAFGIDHRSDGKPSVMSTWVYKVPTSYDVASANSSY